MPLLRVIEMLWASSASKNRGIEKGVVLGVVFSQNPVTKFARINEGE